MVTWSFAPQAPPDLTQLASQRLAETRYSVLHGDLQACEAFDVQERLPSIFQPVLILAGEEDRMMPVRNSHLLANSIPNTHLEIIPGAGHMVMLEQPQVVANAMRLFLSQIPY